MAKTSIEWTEFSVNPFKARNKKTGKAGHFCIKVSPGCANCYSSAMQPRFGTFPFLAENRDKVELFLDEKVLEGVLHRKKPTIYFWFSMTDPFWEGYSDEWVDRCFAVMALSPHHTHKVLTKRAERMYEYFSKGNPALRVANRAVKLWQEYRVPYTSDWPLPNVHLGVSVENQATADERIPWLLKTPAAVRFVSYEPALGPVDFRQYLPGDWACENECGWRGMNSAKDADYEGGEACPDCGAAAYAIGDHEDIDQIICGGESGPGARPMHPDWVRNIRNQCEAAGTSFFFKQWGEWVSFGPQNNASGLATKGMSGQRRDWPGDRLWMQRVGKKAAGRLLDGREWNEVPAIRQSEAPDGE